MTVVGVVASTFIGATGLGVILPSPDEEVQKTVFVEVEKIKSTRYTSKDAEIDWQEQAEVDLKQDLAIMRLQSALDELVKHIEVRE